VSRRIEKTGEIDAPVETVYQVVADVERYPEFLPGVKRVARLEGDWVEMTVGLGPIDVTWTSKASLTPYESIVIDLVEGPFRQMDVRWEFVPQGKGTRIKYTTDYELRLSLPGMGRIVSRAIEANTEATMRAFRRRIFSL
jgi:ribosome-associated toxin RatA of RatAB toxin-antitoxin module